MSIWEKLRGRARDITGTVTEQYRGHIGQELAQKEQRLEVRRAALDQREGKVAEREANLSRYYLIPKIYLQLPLLVALCAGAFFAYRALQSSVTTSGTAPTASERETSSSSEPDYSTCVRRGIKYYKEIGSFPALSTGEDAELKVSEMCSNSGFAFAD